MKNKEISIAVIGLGYVGLPLANELSKKFFTTGFDTDVKKIKELKQGIDRSKEILSINKSLNLTSNILHLSKCNFYIFCLPTPVNKNKKPDLKILNSSLKNFSKIIKKSDHIIIESTYYPGATEKLIRNNFKNKKINIGYSPERINPGDSKKSISKITKVISANNKKTLSLMSKIYGTLNNKNIYKAKNIKVAEAAKLIENVQRDLNIGLINELSVIFNKLNISIHDVLNTAKTKWNFINFKPGLVGGHCIGVDPYYLKHICNKIKFKPKVFMSARNTNEKMIYYYKQKISKYLSKTKKILFLGITFKENTNDLRNSKYLDLMKILSKKYSIDAFDPLINDKRLKIKNKLPVKIKIYDVIIFAVPHKKLLKLLKNKINFLLKKNGIFIDLNNNFKNIDKQKYRYITL